MRKTIFFLLFAVIVTSCSTVLLTGRKQLLLVNDSEVLASSFQSYKQFIDSVPASKDKVNTALVKKVGGKISKVVEEYLKANGMAADAATYAWEFNLVKDTTMNAFCMPGGKVVVFEGILPVTKNEVGLAVVLGHEIAHAIAKHSNERMSQQMLVQYGASLTDLLTSKKSDITRSTIGTIYGIGSQYGVMLPYSRKHEYEADKLGLIFLAMAGYDPNEAINFWGRMADKAGNKPIEFMSTHPSDENRIAQLKAYLPEAMKYYKK
ncbi:peptidase M48 Ste24p [Paludibacter propionicigenes WB4]|uniref:Type IV secretion system putative lipoprotein virB7 n=1 Tax=Paludibacter propionicigenes (strain DSM 17365 / JCM 13257 / WB4) TaxID=694427 RepID=E4T645_PALPW|nr:M48 family metallopeptidase [Paludibacter propionicigenes]ADQ80189.1 peptidase M48 Ste24p [Paludibacter propionicigenes WB4]